MSAFFGRTRKRRLTNFTMPDLQLGFDGFEASKYGVGELTILSVPFLDR